MDRAYPTYNYQEAMERVEQFMEASGVRDFCTNYCKGDCCSAQTCKKPCYETNRRRLMCSIFLCEHLFELLFQGTYYSKNRPIKYFVEVKNKIEDELGHAGQIGLVNKYFKPYPLAVRKTFRISKGILDKLKKINITALADRMYNIRRIVRSCIDAQKKEEKT